MTMLNRVTKVRTKAVPKWFWSFQSSSEAVVPYFGNSKVILKSDFGSGFRGLRDTFVIDLAKSLASASELLCE